MPPRVNEQMLPTSVKRFLMASHHLYVSPSVLFEAQSSYLHIKASVPVLHCALADNEFDLVGTTTEKSGSRYYVHRGQQV